MFLTRRATGDVFDLFRELEGHVRRSHTPATVAGRLPTSGSGREESDWVAWYPAAESFTKDGALVLRMEIPGVDPEKVEVTMSEGRLTIRGEKQMHSELNESDLYLREIARGRFERSFTLPEGVKIDQIKAQHLNGVLEVSIPVANESEKTRRIPVETGSKGWFQKTA